MPASSTVNAGDPILASQYNNLRSDALDKVLKAGDTMTGQLVIDRGAIPALTDSAYSTANIELKTNNDLHPRIGFHEVGSHAVALYKEVDSEHLRLRGASGMDVAVWDGGNDGSGSGLDADMVDGLHGASFVRTQDGATRRLQAGRTAEQSCTNGATTAFSVTFPTVFSGIPNVVATIFHSAGTITGNPGSGGLVEVYISAISTTGFTAQVRNNDGGARAISVEWMAVGST